MNDVVTNTAPAGPTATTPFLKNEDRLGPLDSRYVDVGSLPWKPTPCAGIEMKILVEDPGSGLMTALFRWQPGAELTLHEHVEVEQTFVLEGSLVDEEGEASIFRPANGNYTLVARVQIDEWPRIAAAK